jgi:hypothetical protein
MNAGRELPIERTGDDVGGGVFAGERIHLVERGDCCGEERTVVGHPPAGTGTAVGLASPMRLFDPRVDVNPGFRSPGDLLGRRRNCDPPCRWNDRCVGHDDAEALTAMKGVEIGQAVERRQRPGIETSPARNAGERLARRAVVGATDEGTRALLLIRTPGSVP